MRLADRLQEQEVAIFLFHGVVREHVHVVRNYMRKHIDRTRFLQVLRELKSSGTPISLDDLVATMESGRKPPPRSFVVTFDDGFENNLSVAAPVLDKLGIPATFYVTTSFIEQNLMSWVDRLEWCLEAVPACVLHLPWRTELIEVAGTQAKVALLTEIRAKAKSDRTLDVDRFVSSMFAQCGKDEIRSSDDPLDRKMTWAQVAELAKSPLFTLGGHSHSHAILSFLSPPALAAELDRSMVLLAANGIGPRHYSYPEGLPHCYSPAVVRALRGRGVVCCPTAVDGTNPVGTSLFHLNRIMVT